jgi:hypothetical protein
MKHTPVVVVWRDIFDEGPEWIHPGADPIVPVVVRTAAYLLCKNADFVVVARDYYDHEGARVYGGRMAIPYGCIDSITGIDL